MFSRQLKKKKLGEEITLSEWNTMVEAVHALTGARMREGIKVGGMFHTRIKPSAEGSDAIEIRKAYCKVDAGAGTTIVCYLDTDATGEEITVHIEIAGSSTNLNNASPLLEDGTLIHVYDDDDTWRAFQTFDSTGDC